jgi:hypothetical protein
MLAVNKIIKYINRGSLQVYVNISIYAEKKKIRAYK